MFDLFIQKMNDVTNDEEMQHGTITKRLWFTFRKRMRQSMKKAKTGVYCASCVKLCLADYMIYLNIEFVSGLNCMGQ